MRDIRRTEKWIREAGEQVNIEDRGWRSKQWDTWRGEGREVRVNLMRNKLTYILPTLKSLMICLTGPGRGLDLHLNNIWGDGQQIHKLWGFTNPKYKNAKFQL